MSLNTPGGALKNEMHPVLPCSVGSHTVLVSFSLKVFEHFQQQC